MFRALIQQEKEGIDMAKKSTVPYGVHSVANQKVKVKDRRGYTYEYDCMIFSHNYSDDAYYTVNYETGVSWNGGQGKLYGRYATKAQAKTALTKMKAKLRKQGHPFSG